MKRLIIRVGVCLVLAVAVYSGRIWYLASRTTDPLLQDALNKNGAMVVEVMEYPDVREFVKYVTVARVDSTTNRPASFERIRLTLQRLHDISYGDVVEIEGTLLVPQNFETDTGREFEYRSYLAVKDIYYEMKHPKIRAISRGNGNPILHALFAVRKRFLESLSRVLPAPHSDLAAGMIVGEKQALSKEMQTQFRNVGLIHMVVLSGYNVSIIASSIVGSLGFLRKNAARAFGAGGILLFALLVGGGATVMRASCMALVLLFAESTGHSYNATRALFFACAVMIFLNPRIFLHDPSFQLSALATFAVIEVSPLVEKKLSVVTERFGLRSSIASTLGTQLFLLPMLVYMSGSVSIVSLVTNILVPFVIPATMLFAFLGAVAGFISSTIGSLVATPAYIALVYVFKVVRIADTVPFAYIQTPPISWSVVCIIYSICAILYVRKKIFTQRLLSADFVQSPPS